MNTLKKDLEKLKFYLEYQEDNWKEGMNSKELSKYIQNQREYVENKIREYYQNENQRT